MKRKVLLPLMLLSLIAVGCGQKKIKVEQETFEQHPTWTADSTDNFWK